MANNSQTVWGQLTDKIEHDKYPYTNFLELQFWEFMNELHDLKIKKAFARLYRADLIYPFGNSMLSDSLVDTSSGIEP